MEEAMVLPFEFVNNCKPGDLLRVKIEDAAEFAILGANEGRGLRVLVVLKDNEPPFAINLLESGRIDGDFETYAALVYDRPLRDRHWSALHEGGESRPHIALGESATTS